MGWLWASPSPPKPSTPVENKPVEQKPAPNEPKFDPAIQEFIDLFSTDTKKPEAPKPPPPRVPSASSASSEPEKKSSWLSLKASKTPTETPDAPPRSPLSESLLPVEMSCRQAFDLAWSCNSLGGQWNAVYRHGEMKSCSDQWEDFWFCMRQKGSSGPVKEEAVRTHYRNREYEKYYAPGKRSSEDVWEAREVRLNNTFSQSID